MSTPAVTKGSDSPVLRDDTIRFLCGAAHHDEEFAGAVLRDAVAARTRRKVRDGVPPVVVLFAANGWLLGSWLPVAVSAGLVTEARIGLGRRVRQGSPHERGPLAPGTVVGMLALLFVFYKVTTMLSGSGSRSSDGYEQESGDDGLAIVLIFVVLPTDRDTTWRTEWTIRRLGQSNYAEALARYPVDDDVTDDPEQARVTVHHISSVEPIDDAEARIVLPGKHQAEGTFVAASSRSTTTSSPSTSSATSRSWSHDWNRPCR